MGTRLDASSVGFVVLCSDCPGWREHRLTRIGAAQVRADHERTVHGQLHGAGARAAYRTRQAATL